MIPELNVQLILVRIDYPLLIFIICILRHLNIKNTKMPFMEYYISTKPLHLLRHSAHIIHLASHNIITPSLTSKPLRPSLDTTSDTFEISSAIINSALLCDNSIKIILKDIAFQFINFNYFQFFSDGSVSNIGTTDSKSGFGWIQTNPTIPGLSFKGSIIFSRPLSKVKV